MPDCMILKQELACERRAGIQGYGSCTGQIFLTECTYCSRSRRTVPFEQVQCGFPRDGSELGGVPRVHCVDILHRQAGYRMAACDGLRQMNLYRVNACYVVHYDCDRSSVFGYDGLPLRVGQRPNKIPEGARPLFKAISQPAGT
jgi:hypothetical protein